MSAARPLPESGGDPVVAFEHAFFKAVPDGYFRISDHTGQPVFVVRLGEMDATLSLPGIRSEFHLAEDSPDAAMLDLVARGLKFVRALRIGDPVPKELLTGEASWEITARHRQIALHRITVQLVTWWSGAETPITDPERLLRIAEDPAMREQASQAIGKAAERLGADKSAIEGLVSELAGELAYVEALRERLGAVKAMQRKIDALRRRYGHERGMLEIADPVARLMSIAVKSFQEIFDHFDAQTAEIVGALKNVEAQKRFIQTARDDLYARLLAWDEILAAWSRVEIQKSEGHGAVLRKTYQFLAPRFMQGDEWVLASKLISVAGAPGQAGGRSIPNSVAW